MIKNGLKEKKEARFTTNTSNFLETISKSSTKLKHLNTIRYKTKLSKETKLT